jgi:hypothetical protein
MVLEEMFLEGGRCQVAGILNLMKNCVKRICKNMQMAARTVLNLIKSQIGTT